MRFADELKQLRVAAGSPSLRQLTGRGPGLSQATISNLLNGKFTKAPRWEVVHALVQACVALGSDESGNAPTTLADLGNLGRWRRRHAQLVEILDQIRDTTTRKSATSGAELAGDTTSKLRLRFGAVPQRAGCFQDRAAVQVLDRAVHAGETAVLAGSSAVGTMVLSGLGGVGKTQIAADYARTLWEQSELDLLAWITAGSREAILSAYALLAAELTGIQDADAEQGAQRLLAWLAGTQIRWLLVLDDVQAPADLRMLWPSHTLTGRVVVTTRRRDDALIGDRRQLIEIGLFTPQESVAYLSAKLPAQAHSAEQVSQLEALADDLGHLPLALAQASAYIADRPMLSCSDYRRRWGDRRRMLAELVPDSQALPDEHQATMTATWSLSIELADQLAPAGLARPVLELASVLDPNGIPATVFTAPATCARLSRAAGRELTADDALDALACLHRLNLIALDPNAMHRVVRVHNLVQRATRDMITEANMNATARTAADALLHVWPAVERDSELAQVLRANTNALLTNTGPHLWDPNVHLLLLRAGNSLGDAGLLSAAINFGTRTHVTAAMRLGVEDLTALVVRSNVAGWRGEAGDVAGAIAALEQLLADMLRILGPGHPSTLLTRNNLVGWRREAGDIAGAIAAYEQLLADQLQVLSPDHPYALLTRNNLARCRGHTGDVAGAITEFEQLVADRLRVLGPDHPDTLTSRGDLAKWREEIGCTAEAIAEHEQLLKDMLRVLGPDHPNTLSTRGNLASLRGQAGDMAGAIAEFGRLLADELQVLGRNHPSTLTTRANLATWRGLAGEVGGAIAESERILADRLRVLGPNHPQTLLSHQNLAALRKLNEDA